MRSLAIEAAAAPGFMGEFQTKRLNRWTSAKGAWLNMQHWKAGAKKPVDLDELEVVPCFGGLDLASVSDITAFVLVWMLAGRLKVWGRYYLPEATVRPRTERVGSLPELQRRAVARASLTVASGRARQPGNRCASAMFAIRG